VSLSTELMTGAVLGGTSILYAALGESVSERAGVINLGTEGSMLVGALAGYAITSESGDPWVGLAGAAAGGALLAAVHGYFVLWRRTNQLATGLVVLFLALGLTSLFGVNYVQSTIDSFQPISIPVLSSIPVFGEVLFEQTAPTYLSYVLVPLIWLFLFRTRPGLYLRAAGERRDVLATYGRPVRLVQMLAVLAGGALAGIGGGVLSTAYTNAWFENMVQGRGFVAVAVAVFAARNPFKVMAGAYLFGAAFALSPILQVRGVDINQFALDALPYVLVIVVLVVIGRRGSSQAPEGLQEVFEGGASG
jgi:general nucleoside transport system permease protein